MKVGIATVQVPFISGGAEIHAASLQKELRLRGFEAEIITMPFKWYPPECLLDMMLAARMLDVTAVNGRPIDRLITLKFPAYYFPHPHKVAWILHQHRQAYDLYGTPFGDLHPTENGRAVAREIQRWDRRLLPQHRRLFANSKRVADRLQRYNQLDAEPLYHPPGNHERYRCEDYDNFILAPGRFDAMKRQHLLIEAMAKIPAPIQAVFIGPVDSEYGEKCLRRIVKLGLEDRIQIRGIVSEEEKIGLYARCLGVYNGVYDEDFGYITLEAFLASKPVLTFQDSGGPLEFVQDGVNGFIMAPEAEALAQGIACLTHSRRAEDLGHAGRETLAAQKITWEHVIEKLMNKNE